MNKFWRFFFSVLLLIFVFHLIRDILQIYKVENILTIFDISLFPRPHYWCKPYCDYVTLSPEIFGIIASFTVLRRNKIGLLGKFVLISLVFWLYAILMP